MVCEIWANFTDDTYTEINAAYFGEQDYDYFPFQQKIMTDDPRFLEYAAKFPPGVLNFC